MNKKANPISLIAIIFIIGVISSFITSDFELGALLPNWAANDLETTLDFINLGLGFLALGLVVVFFFFRSARKKENTDEIEDGEWEE